MHTIPRSSYFLPGHYMGRIGDRTRQYITTDGEQFTPWTGGVGRIAMDFDELYRTGEVPSPGTHPQVHLTCTTTSESIEVLAREFDQSFGQSFDQLGDQLDHPGER